MYKRHMISDNMKQIISTLKPQHACFVVEYFKDFSPRRAAEAAGFAADYGYQLLDHHEKVKDAIKFIVKDRFMETGFDAEWLLHELVDNHRIARMQGNIPASNAALKMLAQHVSIDAMVKQKVELDIKSDVELFDRLARGRVRMNDPIDAEAVEVVAEGKLLSIAAVPSFMEKPSQKPCFLAAVETDTGVEQETSQECVATP